MPAESLKAFDEIKSLASFPRSTVLFAEGRPVRGIYILCDGRAKLSICSETGKRLTLRIAGPGEVLGLGARSVQHTLRGHGRAARQLAGGLRAQQRPAEVPARKPHGVPGDCPHAEPGPARSLRTGSHHRHGTHAPPPHQLPAARNGGLTQDQEIGCDFGTGLAARAGVVLPGRKPESNIPRRGIRSSAPAPCVPHT